MAISVSAPVREGILIGGLRWKIVDITLDTAYPTGGYSLGNNVAGLTNVVGGQPIGGNSTSGGYRPHYDAVNNKLMMFRVPGFTPAGLIAVTDGDVTVGGGAAGTALGITADSNAGALTKAAATTRTIPQATFGIAATTAALTGTAVAATVQVEVSNGVNLSTSIVRMLLYGD